jgi:protein-S-isoprenylcysteine O-methyltransferase Ste14
MQLLGWMIVMVSWLAWAYPFIFHAPHNQKRPSVTVIGPTRIGLLLESLAIFLAFVFHLPTEDAISPGRVLPALLLGPAAAVMAWKAITHLGKQFRVHAGLYHDHELVRTGPYSIVRHPIYTSLLAMLLCSSLVFTQWLWVAITTAIFIIGTEIRVRSEDALLESRFGEEFRQYQRQVSAYIPFIR